MSKTKNWIMDLEEKAYDTVANNVGDCEHEAEAMEMAVKVFSENSLLGNYVEVDDLEGAVSEMWQEHCLAHA